MLEGFWAAGTTTVNLVVLVISLFSAASCLIYLWSLISIQDATAPPRWQRNEVISWASVATLSNLYMAALSLYLPGAGLLAAWLGWLDVGGLLVHAAFAAVGFFALIVAVANPKKNGCRNLR